MYRKRISRVYNTNCKVRSTKLILAVLVASVIFILCFTINCSEIMFTKEKPEDTLCYYLDSNVLESVNEISPAPDAIFFHETSCRGGLDSRQACSVESAARAHPQREIYVIFSGPVERITLESEPLSLIRKFPNVKFRRVFILDYAAGTPVEQVVVGGSLTRSRWIVVHTSDALRLLTLYKWSGLYLDLDTIVVKPMDDLPKNFVTRENDFNVANSPLAFSDDKLGRMVSNLTVRDLAKNFNGSIWGQNGPRLITRVFRKLCGTHDVTLMSARICKGFEVYTPDFHPLLASESPNFFRRGELKPAPQAYFYHMWNKQTHALTVHPDSPYAKLSKQFCPSVYATYKNRW